MTEETARKMFRRLNKQATKDAETYFRTKGTDDLFVAQAARDLADKAYAYARALGIKEDAPRWA